MSDAALRFRHVAPVSREDMYVGRAHHRVAGIDSANDTDVEPRWTMFGLKGSLTHAGLAETADVNAAGKSKTVSTCILEDQRMTRDTGYRSAMANTCSFWAMISQSGWQNGQLSTSFSRLAVISVLLNPLPAPSDRSISHTNAL